MSNNKRNFEGHARRTGFNSIQLSRAAINANKKSNAEDLRVLREQQIDEEQKKLQLIRGKDAAFRADQAQMDANQNLEGDYAQNYLNSIATNKGIANESLNTRLDNIKRKGEDLRTFSEGAANIAINIDKIRTENKEVAALIAGFDFDLSDEQVQEELKNAEIAEDTLQAYSTQRQKQVALYLKAGLDPKFIAEEVSKDKNADFRLVKENIKVLAAQYPQWFQNKIHELGVTTSAEIAIARGAISYQYLAENGFVDEKGKVINRSALRPLFQGMQSAYNSEVNAATMQELEVATTSKYTDYLDVWSLDKDNPQNFYNLIESTKNLVKDGKAVGTGAVQYLMTNVLSDVDTVSNQELEDILDLPIPKEWAQKAGQTFRDRYQTGGVNGAILAEVFEKRSTDAHNNRVKNERIEAQVHKKKIEESLAYVRGDDPDKAWDGDEKDLNKLILEMKKEGIDTNQLEVYLVESNENKNELWWTEYLQEKDDNGDLLLSDLTDAAIPPDVRTKFADKARSMEDLYKEAGAQESEITSTFNTLLRGKLGAESTDDQVSYTLNPALWEARKLFKRTFKYNLKTTDPVRALNDAVTSTVETIEKGEGKWKVIGGREHGGKGFFAGFKSGDHEGAYTVKPDLLEETLVEIAKDPSKLKTQLLFEPSVYKKINEQLKAGGSITMPDLLNDLDISTKGEHGTRSEMLNNQLELFDKQNGGIYPERMGVTIRDKLLEETEDDAIKNIIKRIKTPTDLYNAAKIIEAEKGNIDPKELMDPSVASQVTDETSIDQGGSEPYDYDIKASDFPLPESNGSSTIQEVDLDGTIDYVETIGGKRVRLNTYE